MLGPAEVREITEALGAATLDSATIQARGPYITPSFSMGMAMAKTAGAGFSARKPTSNGAGFKF